MSLPVQVVFSAHFGTKITMVQKKLSYFLVQIFLCKLSSLFCWPMNDFNKQDIFKMICKVFVSRKSVFDVLKTCQKVDFFLQRFFAKVFFNFFLELPSSKSGCKCWPVDSRRSPPALRWSSVWYMRTKEKKI